MKEDIRIALKCGLQNKGRFVGSPDEGTLVKPVDLSVQEIYYLLQLLDSN